MSAKVEGAFEAAETASANAPAVIEGAAPLPGWEPLRELLLDAVGSADAYAEWRFSFSFSRRRRPGYARRRQD